MKRQLLIHVNFSTVQLEIYFSKKKRITSTNQQRILLSSFNFQIKVLIIILAVDEYYFFLLEVQLGSS